MLKQNVYNKTLMFRVSYFSIFFSSFCFYMPIYFFIPCVFRFYLLWNFYDQKRNKTYNPFGHCFYHFYFHFSFYFWEIDISKVKAKNKRIWDFQRIKQGHCFSSSSRFNFKYKLDPKKVTINLFFFLHFNKVFFYFFGVFLFYIKLVGLTDCCFFLFT